MKRLMAFLLAAATVLALCGGVVAAPAKIQGEKTWMSILSMRDG